MEAPGKGTLKVCSILFIVFGGIAALISLLAIIGAAALASQYSYYGYAGVAAGALVAASVVGLIGSGLDIVIGIMGLKKAGDPSQYNFFVVTGIVLCVIQLVSMIMNFSVLALIGFILPILYIYGGYQNKNARTF